MREFKVGDVVRLTSEDREHYRRIFITTGDEDYSQTFVEMVLKGAKATVSSVDNNGIWLENNLFWLPQTMVIPACQDIAIGIHNTVGSSPVQTQYAVEHDAVKSPKHYAVIGEYQVKDINKAILDSMLEEGFDITLDEAGWWQQAMQYLMRGHKKGGIEDYKKAIQAMQFVVESMEERNERKN